MTWLSGGGAVAPPLLLGSADTTSFIFLYAEILSTLSSVFRRFDSIVTCTAFLDAEMF